MIKLLLLGSLEQNESTKIVFREQCPCLLLKLVTRLFSNYVAALPIVF
jgi:hypothetical protein